MEISNIPMLPQVNPANAINEDAEPVSDSCCSNIRFALGEGVAMVQTIAMKQAQCSCIIISFHSPGLKTLIFLKGVRLLRGYPSF